jgi:ribosomal protein L37AE/L43A
MKNDRKQEKNEEEKRMELKYCERCGGLWLRECGAGVVYCGNCEREVADLPVPKKKPQRVKVPVLPHSVAESYRFEHRENEFRENFDRDLQNDGVSDDFPSNDGPDLEAAGGAA